MKKITLLTSLILITITINISAQEKKAVNLLGEMASAPGVQVIDRGTKLACFTSESLHIFDISQGKTIVTIECGNRVSSMAVNEDYTTFYAGLISGEIISYELPGGKQITSFKAGEDAITALALSHDLQELAYGTSSGQLAIIDSELKELKKEVMTNGKYISDIMFSQDDRYLISAGQAKAISVWESQSGDLFKSLSKHRSWVRGLDLSPDGKRFVSCGDDKNIYEWDLTSKEVLEPVQSFKGTHGSWIMDVVYQSDGNFLASVGHDNKIRFSPLNSQAKKNLRILYDQELVIKKALFAPIKKQYLNSVCFIPGTFKLIMGSHNAGLYQLDYYQHFYEMDSSLFKVEE